MSGGLVARDLVKRFGPVEAVAGVSLAVQPGEVLGLLGPNGAGKTTTMRMIAGFLRPSAGTASISGHDVIGAPLAARRRLGYLPEGAPGYDEMTPRQFLAFICAARALGNAEARIDGASGRLGLDSVLDRPIETLSKGFRRRVGLAQAVIHDPDVLLLDEPTDGLDPNQKQVVRDLIAELRPAKAIIISTHILEEVEAMCTRAVILDRGRIVADGTPAQLKARSRYAHAVTVTLPAGTDLSGLEAPGVMDTVALPDGRITVTFLSPDGKPVLNRVGDILGARKLQPSDVSVETGRLEDVFRSLTRPEAAA
jgi:ABC-2 type transport system ATP-binding protein